MLSFLFRCFKSHCTNWLIKALGVDNSLGNPTYTSTTLTKKRGHPEKSLVCIVFLLEFQSMMMNWTSVTLLYTQITYMSLQPALCCWVCQMLHETRFQIIYINQHSQPSFKVAMTGVVWIRYGFWNIQKTCVVHTNNVSIVIYIIKHLPYLHFI